MSCFDTFCKACPASLALTEQPEASTCYKYLLCGKGCVLGVLFEDTTEVYFEWVHEDEAVVAYPPRLRYKSWPKRTVADLIQRGVWEAEPTRPLDLTPHPHTSSCAGQDVASTLSLN